MVRLVYGQRISHEEGTERAALADMVESVKTDAKKQQLLVGSLERDATTKQLLVDQLQKTERDNAACLKNSEGELATSRSTTRVELEKLRVELQAQGTYFTLEVDDRDDALRELQLARLATRSELIDGAAVQALILTTDVRVLV